MSLFFSAAAKCDHRLIAGPTLFSVDRAFEQLKAREGLLSQRDGELTSDIAAGRRSPSSEEDDSDLDGSGMRRKRAPLKSSLSHISSMRLMAMHLRERSSLPPMPRAASTTLDRRRRAPGLLFSTRGNGGESSDVAAASPASAESISPPTRKAHKRRRKSPSQPSAATASPSSTTRRSPEVRLPQVADVESCCSTRDSSASRSDDDDDPSRPKSFSLEKVPAVDRALATFARAREFASSLREKERQLALEAQRKKLARFSRLMSPLQAPFSPTQPDRDSPNKVVDDGGGLLAAAAASLFELHKAHAPDGMTAEDRAMVHSGGIVALLEDRKREQRRAEYAAEQRMLASQPGHLTVTAMLRRQREELQRKQHADVRGRCERTQQAAGSKLGALIERHVADRREHLNGILARRRLEAAEAKRDADEAAARQQQQQHRQQPRLRAVTSTLARSRSPGR